VRSYLYYFSPIITFSKITEILYESLTLEKYMRIPSWLQKGQEPFRNFSFEEIWVKLQ